MATSPEAQSRGTKSHRRPSIIELEPYTKEYEIAIVVEEWEERCRILQDVNESALPGPWRITALRRLLCRDINKQLDFSKRELVSYADLRTNVMILMVSKRIAKSCATSHASGGEPWSQERCSPWDGGRAEYSGNQGELAGIANTMVKGGQRLGKG